MCFLLQDPSPEKAEENPNLDPPHCIHTKAATSLGLLFFAQVKGLIQHVHVFSNPCLSKSQH